MLTHPPGLPDSSPLLEGSRSKDRDREPREEKAESTDDSPDSLLPLLPLPDPDGSWDSEALRLSSSGPSRLCEMPESSCDNSSARLRSSSRGGAEARLRGVDTGTCHEGGSHEGRQGWYVPHIYSDT